MNLYSYQTAVAFTFKYLANHESGVCVVCSVLSDSKCVFKVYLFV